MTADARRPAVQPVVTVIIPVRNRPREVVIAIESCLREREVPLEVIVVDDGSTDGTAAEVAALDDHRVQLIRQTALGVTVARNRAARAARGEWLVPLDSDDTLVPGALSALLARAEPDVDVVSGVLEQVGGSSSHIRPRPLGPAFDGVTANFLAGAMLVRAAAWRDVGGQLEGVLFGENTELGMRLAARAAVIGRRVVAIDAVTARYAPPATDRHDHAGRAAATVTILRSDRALVSRSRAFLSTSWAIAAVQYARCDRPRDAITCQWLAVRSQPGRARHHARLVVLALPPLRRRRYQPRVHLAS